MHSNVPFSRMQFRVDIADVRFDEASDVVSSSLYVWVGPCVLLGLASSIPPSHLRFFVRSTVTAHLDEKRISGISIHRAFLLFVSTVNQLCKRTRRRDAPRNISSSHRPACRTTCILHAAQTTNLSTSCNPDFSRHPSFVFWLEFSKKKKNTQHRTTNQLIFYSI